MKILNSGASSLGLQLSPNQLEQFEVYYHELIDWNRRVNLTTITGYDEVQVNHFLDALTVALVWQPSAGSVAPRILDVGTGGGVPGVPLKITFPQIRLVLLEATAKKAAFLHHLRDRLKLKDVEIVVGRAEEVAHNAQYREEFDPVLSRAVAPLPALAELTLPFCAVGGSVVVHKKGDIEVELKKSSRAIDTCGGKLREVKAVDLSEFPDKRYLVVIDKVSATPEQYPRRPGIPKKRPIR
ncbi:MAG: 16S rRNA (guanine(527)-N(7))-methyltransferase RsmG [Dehalococcoidales bacterium]|nr:MAG: 16S rRNA (guanine(527)-N(7))-methyltransferase RsmG [Dehalococcoidales bacterium]